MYEYLSSNSYGFFKVLQPYATVVVNEKKMRLDTFGCVNQTSRQKNNR